MISPQPAVDQSPPTSHASFSFAAHLQFVALPRFRRITARALRRAEIRRYNNIKVSISRLHQSPHRRRSRSRPCSRQRAGETRHTYASRPTRVEGCAMAPGQVGRGVILSSESELGPYRIDDRHPKELQLNAFGLEQLAQWGIRRSVYIQPAHAVGLVASGGCTSDSSRFTSMARRNGFATPTTIVSRTLMRLPHSVSIL